MSAPSSPRSSLLLTSSYDAEWNAIEQQLAAMRAAMASYQSHVTIAAAVEAPLPNTSAGTRRVSHIRATLDALRSAPVLADAPKSTASGSTPLNKATLSLTSRVANLHAASITLPPSPAPAPAPIRDALQSLSLSRLPIAPTPKPAATPSAAAEEFDAFIASTRVSSPKATASPLASGPRVARAFAKKGLPQWAFPPARDAKTLIQDIHIPSMGEEAGDPTQPFHQEELLPTAPAMPSLVFSPPAPAKAPVEDDTDKPLSAAQQALLAKTLKASSGSPRAASPLTPDGLPLAVALTGPPSNTHLLRQYGASLHSPSTPKAHTPAVVTEAGVIVSERPARSEQAHAQPVSAPTLRRAPDMPSFSGPAALPLAVVPSLVADVISSGEPEEAPALTLTAPKTEEAENDFERRLAARWQAEMTEDD